MEGVQKMRTETWLKIAAGVVLLWVSMEDIKCKKVCLYKLCALVPIGIIQILVGAKPSYVQIGAGLLLGAIVIVLSLATHEKIGLADGLCIAFLGFDFGFTTVFLIFVLALVLAACLSTIMLLLKKVELKTAIPFFPFLFLGYVGVMLW